MSSAAASQDSLIIVSSQNVRMVERPQDAQRQQRMRDAWQGYNGELPAPLTIEPGEPDHNVNTNRLAPIVDTGVAWLFGDPLGIEVDPDQALLGGDEPQEAAEGNEEASGLDDRDDTPQGEPATEPGQPGQPPVAAKPEKPAINPKVKAAQDALDGCWGDEDDRMTLLAKHAINGKVCGHAFWKILPPDPNSGRQYPRLVELDPMNVTMRTDPEDCDTAISYSITYDSETEDGAVIQKRQVIARRDDGKAWLIRNYLRAGNSQWMPSGPEQIWPHPWAPIVDNPNFPVPNQRWGRPDITPNLLQLNRGLNLLASNINKIGFLHGHPWLWASGTNVALIKAQPGHVTGLQHPEAKMGAIEAHGDLPGLMQFEADIRADMDEQSKIPAVATGRMAEIPKGQMSGVTVRMLYQPRIFQNNFERRVYGKAIREASMRMLALCGFGDGTDMGGVKTLLHWSDPIPVDNQQEAQTALLWSQMGVSSDTLMERAGFDPDVERRKNEEADAKQVTAFAHGTGLPPALPAHALPPVSEMGMMPPPEQGNGTGNGGQMPPVNHPAAQAARVAMTRATHGV